MTIAMSGVLVTSWVPAMAEVLAVFEATAMKVAPAWAGKVINDRAATGGTALALTSSGGTAAATVQLPSAATIVVRAKGGTCSNTPKLTVLVDGRAVGVLTVASAAWKDYPVATQVISGPHTVTLRLDAGNRFAFCTGSVAVDTIAVAGAADNSGPAEPPVDTTSRIFNGDYSTANFAQWPTVQNRYYTGSGSGYSPTYSAQIVDDTVKGKAARFEVRSGDVPSFGGGERSEVADSLSGAEGQTLWYAFSTKFDPTYPQNRASLGWGLTNQWHPSSNTGSPPVGWYVDVRNGYWSLVIQKQSAPGEYEQVFSLIDLPLAVGTWHDVKMQVKWSTSDSTGFVRLWHNGVRQKFVDGSDTYFVRTMIPGTNYVYYKEGIYRQPMAPTEIVYHAGFRSASTEAGL
ncbi:heparin lyase I family protein [Mycobacterium sp. 155]|uniref:heparin lyase I family protein n=1 Tax=Mycobacterium sp. 155 TaxID=1157943 RepID=UPI0018DED859|nr:heparin lyase I family protein [Mycobacterium sp. 155]